MPHLAKTMAIMVARKPPNGVPESQVRSSTLRVLGFRIYLGRFLNLGGTDFWGSPSYGL